MSTVSYHPTRVIVLSELHSKEKDKYFDLLLSSNAKFHVNEAGQFVANLRLLAPGVKKTEVRVSKKDNKDTNTLPFEERLKRLQQEGNITVTISGVEPFDYNAYPRFSVLIASNGETVTPRPKILQWLMRLIEELYDTRFAHEAAEVNREDSAAVNEQVSLIFPVFAVRRLSMRVGLRSLVDQTCWDLLYNTHMYRKDYLEVEMFARFLQEFYDHDDLLFFLYVRSVVGKVLHVSFKTRWAKADGPGRQPRSLWMSYRECVTVARTVFGANNEGMCRDFLGIITPQMVGQKTDTGDSRRIDITQFLHLAVVGYHQTRPEEGEMQRPLVPLPDTVVPSVPAPAPSSGIYMSRYTPGRDEPQPTAQSYNDYDYNAYATPSQDYYYDTNETPLDTSREDEYLSAIARDRLEMLEMQKSLGDVEESDNINWSEFDLGDPFQDPLMENLDLADLAATPMHPAGQYSEEQWQEHPEPDHQLVNDQDEVSLTEVQAAREREFLELVCAPLDGFPADVATGIVDELADQLRAKVVEALNQMEEIPSDYQAFDDLMVDILQSDDLQNDIQATRDLMISYVQDRLKM